MCVRTHMRNGSPTTDVGSLRGTHTKHQVNNSHIQIIRMFLKCKKKKWKIRVCVYSSIGRRRRSSWAEYWFRDDARRRFEAKAPVKSRENGYCAPVHAIGQCADATPQSLCALFFASAFYWLSLLSTFLFILFFCILHFFVFSVRVFCALFVCVLDAFFTFQTGHPVWASSV